MIPFKLYRLVLVIGILLASGARAELPTRLVIEPGDTRAQTLPAVVRDVRQGPDGRAWLILSSPDGWTLTQAKAVVEREFDQAMPQVIGLELIGWGREGVAWFIPQGWTPEPKDNRLIGYDGKGWVEYVNKANVVSGPLVVGEAELFAGRSGVVIHDKKGWRVELGLLGTTLPAKMVLDPGGESAVVSFRKEQELYRFRDGQLIQLEDNTGVKDDLTGLVSSRFGVFTCLDGKLHQVAAMSDLQSVKEASEKLTPLIKKLRNADPDQWEAIVSSVIELGEAAYEPVKLASEQTDDPELRMLLKRVVLQLEPDNAGKGDVGRPKRSDAVRIDRYVPGKISFVHQLKTGHVLIGVETGRDTNTGEPLNPGLLVIPPEEPPYFIVDELVNNCALNYELLSSHKVPTQRVVHLPDRAVVLPGHQGKRSWQQGKGTRSWGDNPAIRLDLRTRSLSVESVNLLLAVDKQGHRFTAFGGSTEYSGYSGIDMISPGVPDKRKYLNLGDALQLDTRSHGVGALTVSTHAGVDDEGRLYVIAKGGGVKRYDGTTWSDISGTKLACANRLVLFSRAGAVLFDTGDDARLVVGDRVDAAESIEGVIEAEYLQIVEQFKGGSLPMTPAIGQLLVDAYDNVWFRRGNTVRVFDGEGWVEEDDAKLKTKKSHGKNRYMISLDGGKLIYITNMNARSPRAYYAQLEDGEIVGADAPVGHTATPSFEEPREADGTLWLIKSSLIKGGYGYAAIAIKPGEEPRHLDGYGSPRLMDGHGNLLLFKSEYRRSAEREIAVARGGEIVHRLEVPILAPIGQLVSDKPGSLYGLGVRGLAHYTADAPQEHPYDYELESFYHFEKNGQVRRLFHSKLGFIALMLQEKGDLYLHTVGLPIKPRLSEVDELQASIRKLLDETPRHKERESLEKLLEGHSAEEQVQALLPLVDYKPNENLALPGNYAVIEQLGKLWEESLPHALKLMEDESEMRRACAARIIDEMPLGINGARWMPWMEKAGPALAQLLMSDRSSIVRVEAARALADFDEQAAPYMDALLEAFKGEDIKLQQMAVSALSDVGPDAWAAIPILTQIVKDPGEMSRWVAAEALQEMGPAAVSAGPTLLEVAADPAAYQGKSYVGDALWWIAGMGRWDVDKKVLAKAIVNGDSGGPAYLAAEFGIDDLGVVIALAESLDITDKYDNYNAYTSAESLIRLGTKNKLVLDYLRELAKSDRTYARVWAAAVYGRLAGDPELAVSVLKPILARGESHDAYDSALRAAKLIGPEGLALLPAIRPNTADRNPWTPLNAIQARWMLAGKPDDHLAWVASEVHHRSTNNYADDAATALHLLGPMADEQTHSIAEVLTVFVKYSQYNRFQACTVLRSIGPTANTREALPHLKRMLDKEIEPSPYNRRLAAEAIWSISRDAEVVANALAETLDDRGRNFFWAAHRLEQMGPAASTAIERLEIAATDRNPHFQQAAERALQAIRKPVDKKPATEEDFKAWYNNLRDADDIAAVDAMWRLVGAGAPAKAFLYKRTRLIPPDALDRIEAATEHLPEQNDAFPYPSLEENRQLARALQAIKLMEER